MRCTSSFLAFIDAVLSTTPIEQRRDYLLSELEKLEARERTYGGGFPDAKAGLQQRIEREARAWIAQHEAAPSFAHSGRAF
jgi:hypothetical protein